MLFLHRYRNERRCPATRIYKQIVSIFGCFMPINKIYKEDIEARRTIVRDLKAHRHIDRKSITVTVMRQGRIFHRKLGHDLKSVEKKGRNMENIEQIWNVILWNNLIKSPILDECFTWLQHCEEFIKQLEKRSHVKRSQLSVENRQPLVARIA